MIAEVFTVMYCFFCVKILYDMTDKEYINIGIKNCTLYYHHGYGLTRNTSRLVCNELSIYGYKTYTQTR